MGNDVFADTSGWANLFFASQAHHELAVFVYDELALDGRVLVTTNYVLNELVALLTSPLRIPRKRAIQCIDEILRSPQVSCVHVTESVHQQAWQLLSDRPDKNWSLVDCASFVLMQQLALTDALTADHHFEQAGFRNLLR
jgi:predicted nucleic acid-binding protein